jgi:hypothetical protein
MSRGRALLTIGAISASLTLLTAGAAQAATLYLPDNRGYGYNDGSYRVVACDTRADNWGVRTYYGMANGHYDLVGDANGSASGCGAESTPSPVVWIRVCAGVNGADTVCRP